jgi:hypothetical protein
MRTRLHQGQVAPLPPFANAYLFVRAVWLCAVCPTPMGELGSLVRSMSRKLGLGPEIRRGGRGTSRLGFQIKATKLSQRAERRPRAWSHRPNKDELPGPRHIPHRSFQQAGGPPHTAWNRFGRVVEVPYVDHVEACALR